jgi:hypothetical protein
MQQGKNTKVKTATTTTSKTKFLAQKFEKR